MGTYRSVPSFTTLGSTATVRNGWSGRPDPDGNVFNFFHSKGAQNRSDYLNPEVDKLLEGARVVGMQADVGKLLPFDGAQRLDDAVLERLAADQADVRIGSRLPEQMLGSAEADFEADLAGRMRE